eukprot:tig00000042_g15432.t1
MASHDEALAHSKRAEEQEMFDVLNEDGSPMVDPATAQQVRKKRKECHRDGSWHTSVHTWVINKDGELLLQRRHPTKQSYPDMWDISSAGHVSAGEDSLGTAVRELEEEMGIARPASAFLHLFRFPNPRVHHGGSPFPPVQLLFPSEQHNEWSDVYLVETEAPIPLLRLQATEVTDARYGKWCAAEKRWLENDPTMVPQDSANPKGYKIFFDELRRRYPQGAFVLTGERRPGGPREALR